MADELVLDAPAIDAPEQQAEPQEHTDPVAEVADPHVEVAADGTKRDGRLTPQWLRDLKSTNNPGYKDANEKFWALKALDEQVKDFDVKGTREWLEAQGGREAMEAQFAEREEKVKEFDAYQQLLADGNPNFAQAMREVSGENFPKLAEATMHQWAQSDPDGWNAAASGLVNQIMQQRQIPMEMEKANFYVSSLASAMNAIPGVSDNPVVVNAFNSLVKQLGVFDQFAKSFGNVQAPQRQVQQPGKPSVNDERAQWETQRFNTEFSEQETKQRDPVIQDELKSYFARRPDDKSAQARAVKMVNVELKERMDADKVYQKDLAALKTRRDTAGALRLQASREKAVIKQIAPEIGKDIFGTAVAFKPVVTRTATPSAHIPAKPKSQFDEIWGRA